MKIQLAILAGGLATRLGPLTEKTPKSMVMIQGRPFLEYQLGFLRKSGVTSAVLCIGHLAEQIENYFGDGRKFGMNITYSYESKQLLGTAGALKKAERLLEDPFFTMYGDSYLSLDFADAMSYFKSRDKLALMSVYKNYDRYEGSNTVIKGELVKKFSKKEKTKGMVYIEYGANIFRKAALELIPEDLPYSLDKLFPELIRRKDLLAYEVRERFYQIGSPEGLEEFKRYVMQTSGVTQ
ncbi:MAG: sugar phosphate nucleotidyltransferase [Dehalococcoidia bacterium]|jgi:N-acetyl-alpha-D-muramate 1-phosphate uridylyltransferase